MWGERHVLFRGVIVTRNAVERMPRMKTFEGSTAVDEGDERYVTRECSTLALTATSSRAHTSGLKQPGLLLRYAAETLGREFASQRSGFDTAASARCTSAPRGAVACQTQMAW